MTDRDRLIELVDKAKEEYANDVTDHTETDYIVESLLNEGVIVPPCKVGDTVYYFVDINIPQRLMLESRIYHIEITEITMKFYFHTVKKCQYRYGHFDFNDIGKTVFLTKEEAEEKLKECNK